MILIRKTEKQLAFARKNGLICGLVNLGVGQESIAVGISQKKKTDIVFGGHRPHSYLLALNQDFYRLFAEVLGKETGFSKGMGGGSMHLFDQSNGFYGSTPIVADTVSFAVGATLTAKIQNLKDIGLPYIGDDAVEEGVVHECFNLAKVLKLPVLFVIENNLFASHMHISLRQPSKTTSRFADANCMPHRLLDGNDVVKVAQNSKEFIEN